jgi:hypothetical protein
LNTNKTARTRKNVPTSVNITVDTLPVNVPSAFTLNPVLMEQQDLLYRHYWQQQADYFV